jgi:hypothetical protein
VVSDEWVPGEPTEERTEEPPEEPPEEPSEEPSEEPTAPGVPLTPNGVPWRIESDAEATT